MGHGHSGEQVNEGRADQHSQERPQEKPPPHLQSGQGKQRQVDENGHGAHAAEAQKLH